MKEKAELNASIFCPFTANKILFAPQHYLGQCILSFLPLYPISNCKDTYIVLNLVAQKKNNSIVAFLKKFSIEFAFHRVQVQRLFIPDPKSLKMQA